jgi:hypothetical protein
LAPGPRQIFHRRIRSYTVQVTNISGDDMEYQPEMNAASQVTVNVF